jgi:LuxR family transcriptional regulator, maltose regulon positive regulatory protein
VRLRDLESSSVFLIPEDRTRAWYRYHPLYRDFLLAELQREEPHNIDRLHKLAAGWYESQSSPAIAIEHLLQTLDYEHCAVLVSSLGLSMYQAGQVGTLQRWLAALGDRAVASYPPLGVLSGWIAVISGQAMEAERWRVLVDAMAYEESPADGTTSFSSGRAMLRAAMCANGPEEMLADAEFALAAEPTWSPWRDFALSMVAEAHLLAGRVDDAAEYFRQASERAAAVGNYDVRIRTDTQQALILMDRGRWDDAAGLTAGALDAIHHHRLSDYASAVLTFAAAARLALHLGDTRRADRELTSAMRARPVCTYAMPTVAVKSRLCLAKAYGSMGDFSTARHLLREVDDILLHRPAMGVFLDQQTSLRELVNASSEPGANGPPLTPAELRLLPYLQTHLTVPEIGTRLFVSRNTVSTEVSSIYRKLGVSSRSEAVDRAITIGLLGG